MAAWLALTTAHSSLKPSIAFPCRTHGTSLDYQRPSCLASLAEGRTLNFFSVALTAS